MTRLFSLGIVPFLVRGVTGLGTHTPDHAHAHARTTYSARSGLQTPIKDVAAGTQ